MKLSPEEIAHRLSCSLGLKSGIVFAEGLESKEKPKNPVLAASYGAAALLMRDALDHRNSQAGNNPASA